MRIRNASVFTKEGQFLVQDVCIEKERFAESCSDFIEIDGSGCILIPGLLDIHFHGCVGHDFCDATEEALSRMAEYELKNGITSICPASMTLAEAALIGICKNAVSYRDNWKPGRGSRLCGIHLEGPFLSRKKIGAQNPAYVKAPDAAMFQRLLDASDGLVKLTTIAPEMEHAMDFIRQFSSTVRISVGHTNCDYETASRAFLTGARHMTHLFNTMPPLAHRSPGPIAAGIEHSHVTPELICDGVHVAPAAVRAAFAMFGDDRIIFISDSMMATGMPDGDYSLGELAVSVQGSYAMLADGTLAGSVTNLMDCLRNAVKEMGIPLESAVKATTINPAKAIGEDKEYGSIEIGKYADCLLLDADTLELKKIFTHGMAL